MKAEAIMHGTPASPGIRIGKAYLQRDRKIVLNKNKLNEEELQLQADKVRKAIELTKKQLLNLKIKVEHEVGKDAAEIMEAHLMFLDDAVFWEEVNDIIKAENIAAEYAVSIIADKYLKMFDEMKDEYLKERAADIRDVTDRVIRNILGIVSIKALEDTVEDVIIVAEDLTPSDMAQLDKKKIIAFLTDKGGRTSHTAIMARSLEIPAVTGLTDISKKVNDKDILIVDGNKGLVYINPDQKVVDEYKRKMEHILNNYSELKKFKDLPATTKDGSKTVIISANIGTSDDIKGAIQNGAESVGLYRTEFLYMNRKNFPTEEVQFEAYKAVAIAMAPQPVIIRTLDVGGDKKLSYLNMPDELNPFLGYRAIRLCLDQPNIFKTQLRAILKASHYGNIKIMYPMISCVEEIFKANQILDQVKQELRNEKMPFNEDMDVGIMIEIPAAAIAADILAKESDFFSIGTNDLIQYTLAVDRMNEHVSYLYEPYHPAILRLIKMVIDAAHKEGKWVGMCGEMAGDPAAIPILLGMGLDEFSMSSGAILNAKKIVCSLNHEDAKKMAERALSRNSAAKIKNYQ